MVELRKTITLLQGSIAGMSSNLDLVYESTKKNQVMLPQKIAHKSLKSSEISVVESGSKLVPAEEKSTEDRRYYSVRFLYKYSSCY